ncbi:hypothetical protein [Paenarthrobacter sp. NPDC058040]|uniref:hypothetical protein n=1 Tax=unclassified Paenarthrobacter TaxID=2634190 RepID=UPI0036D9FB11
MTFNASQIREKRILPAVLMAVGGILFIGWIIAMYAMGLIIDEQQLDPSETPLHLMWYGGIAGPAVAFYGAWLHRKPKN